MFSINGRPRASNSTCIEFVGRRLHNKKGQTITRGVLFTEDKIQTTNHEVNTEPIRIDEIISDLSDQVENVCVVLNEYKELVARNLRQVGCTHLA